MAEPAADMFGVKLAQRMGGRRVWLECDVVTVVNAISRKATGGSPIFLFYQEIINTSLSVNAFCCSHIRRVGNTIAHLVAQWEVNIDGKIICSEHFPQSLITLEELDIT